MPFEQVPQVSIPLAADGGADGYAYVLNPAGIYPGEVGYLSDSTDAHQRVLVTDLQEDPDGERKVGLRFLAEERLGIDDPLARSGTVGYYQNAGRSPLTAWTIANSARLTLPAQIVDRRFLDFPQVAMRQADPNVVLYSAAAISTGTYTAKGVRLARNSMVAFIASWTGTPTGTWAFQVSNDSTNGVNGIWVALTLPSAFSSGNPAGGAGSFDFEFVSMPEGWIRAVLTVASGSGTLTLEAERKSA